jgi:hypothetical protein
MIENVSSMFRARFPAYPFLDSISLAQRVTLVACLAIACVAFYFRHLFYTPQPPQNEVDSQRVILGSPLVASPAGATPQVRTTEGGGPILGADTTPLTLEDLITPAAATGNAMETAPDSDGQSSSKLASSSSKIILSDSQLVESAFLKKTGRSSKGSPRSLKGSHSTKSPRLARGYIVVSRRKPLPSALS